MPLDPQSAPIERVQRILTSECKLAVDDAAAGRFSGYGAIFGNRDSYDDVIERGAFAKSLEDWKAKGYFPPMLLQHGGGLFGGGAEDGLPIGVWDAMDETARGLKVDGELLELETDVSRRVYAGMKKKALNGLSIGYRARKFTSGTKPGEPRRRLHEVDLVEVSIVTFPANDKARIGTVKSADIDAIETLSDAEAVLREAGLSKKAALEMVSRVARIARREAGSDQKMSDLLASIRETRRSIVPTP